MPDMTRGSARAGLVAALLCAIVTAVFAAACGGGDTSQAPESGSVGVGSLGVVEVPSGETIHIRSLNTISGDIAYLGIANQRGVELAVADFGPVRGFEVELGTRYDDLCSADGAQSAAQTIVADEDVIGVIGPSCSTAAVAAAPLVTGAGMVLIAPSNTSPTLTSDLAGNPGLNHSEGYYRTSNNGLLVGEAMARFVVEKLELASAAAIHDGDPYSRSIAQAFVDSFDRLGGTVTGFHAINKEDTDMVPVLTEVAAAGPEALFFPIFQPAGDFLTEQAPQVSGLEETVLLTDAALLNESFMSLPQSAGLYFSGPDLRFGATTNESTGKTPDSLLATYEETYGEAPTAPYWAHAYDATTLLLEAITAASVVDDGTLVVDRADVRKYLNTVSDYRGIIGTIGCDAFGDCGSQKITVIHHLDPDDIKASQANIVFEFAP